MESFHSRMESLKYRQSELDEIADNQCHTNLILNCTRALRKFDYCYVKFCSLPSTSLLECTIILLQDSKSLTRISYKITVWMCNQTWCWMMLAYDSQHESKTKNLHNQDLRESMVSSHMHSILAGRMNGKNSSVQTAYSQVQQVATKPCTLKNTACKN